MPTLIIDIILTIISWKRGWGRKALLPLAVLIGVLIFSGYILRVLGIPAETQPQTALLIMDFFTISALIYMSLNPPNK